MSQPEFLYEIFEDFMDSPESKDFSFDNGLVCRWMTGQAKISPKISTYYVKPSKQEKLAETIQQNLLPLMTDCSKATYYNHILTLFSLYSISQEQQDIMRDLCFLPPAGISARIFADWLGQTTLNDINDLIETGFIQANTRHTTSLHPMIQEIALSETRPSVTKGNNHGTSSDRALLLDYQATMETKPEKAIKLVRSNLLKAYKTPDDLNARQHMHHASCLAGMAFSNAGLGLNHGMAHTLGGHFHIPHGRANAILLPYVMAYNCGCHDKLTVHAKRYARIARLARLEGSSIRQSAFNVIRSTKQLIKQLNIPTSIAEAGVSREDFMAALDEMVNAAMNDACTATNPRDCTPEEVRDLFLAAYEGRRI